MERIKRFAIVLAAVITAAASLAACGGSEGGDTKAADKPADTTTTAATTAAPETTTTTAKADEKPADETKPADEAKPAESKDAPAKKDKSIVAKQKEEKPAAPAEQASAPSEYAQAIANTVWIGMDANFNCYAMAFTDQEIVIQADDDSTIQGYWGVVEGDPTFYVFSDAELTDAIFAIPWSLDTENKVIILNGNIAMAETPASSFEEATALLQEQSKLCKIAAYLDGTYWAGPNPDGSYTAMSLANGKLEFYEIEATGEENIGAYLWGLDSNGLTLYDEEGTPLTTMGIAISEDGSQLQMVKGDGSSTVYTQVSSENATNIVAYLHSLVDGGAGAAAEGEGTEDAGAAEDGEEEYGEDDYAEE